MADGVIAEGYYFVRPDLPQLLNFDGSRPPGTPPEIRHREQPLPTRWAAGHDYASAALGHAWLFIEEGRKVMAANFSLKGAKQFRFFHRFSETRSSSDLLHSAPRAGRAAHLLLPI